jgi:hypothetical protein
MTQTNADDGRTAEFIYTDPEPRQDLAGSVGSHASITSSLLPSKSTPLPSRSTGIRAVLMTLEAGYCRIVRALAGLNNEWTLAPYAILHGLGRLLDRVRKKVKP